MSEVNKIIVYIDGGSRGNPGPAALGVAIEGIGKGRTYNSFLGTLTNNEAEYQALLFSLKKVKSLIGKDELKNQSIDIRSDSELLINQVEGRFKIEEPRLQKLFIEFWNIKIDFPNLSFKLIPREQNRTADRLVNNALDKETSTLPGF